MNPANGDNDGESRLDRVERLLAESIVRNEAAHEEFQQEHKRLLTAQVVFHDNLNTPELKLSEAADKLNALIAVMDRHVNEPHPRA